MIQQALAEITWFFFKTLSVNDLNLSEHDSWVLEFMKIVKSCCIGLASRTSLTVASLRKIALLEPTK